MDAERTVLPGIGTSYRIRTAAGPWLGVIRHSDGRRDLVAYAPDDRDTVRISFTLTEQEARDLGHLLAVRDPASISVEGE